MPTMKKKLLLLKMEVVNIINKYSYLKIVKVVSKTPKKDVQIHAITVHEQFS